MPGFEPTHVTRQIRWAALTIAPRRLKVIWNVKNSFQLSEADPGEGPGGPAPLLFLDQTEVQRAEKIFLGDFPSLSRGLDDRPLLFSRSGSGTGYAGGMGKYLARKFVTSLCFKFLT